MMSSIDSEVTKAVCNMKKKKKNTVKKMENNAREAFVSMVSPKRFISRVSLVSLDDVANSMNISFSYRRIWV